MIRFAFPFFFLLLGIGLQAQIQSLNPSDFGLRLEALTPYGNQYIASTLQPYFLKFDRDNLSPNGYVDFQPGFRVENLAALGDSILYEWKRPYLSQAWPVSYSKDGGQTWYIHPKLRNYSGHLHFFDSLFVVDGENTLIRYTLDGGSSYDSLSLSGSSLMGKDANGAFLRKSAKDSLVYLEASGPRHIGVLDSNWGTLNHLQKGGYHYFVLHNGTELIDLDSGFNYLQSIHHFKPALQAGIKSYKNGDTLVYAKEDSVLYSFDSGQSWVVKGINAPLNRARTCLGLAGSQVIYSHGAGTLLLFSLKNNTLSYSGQNSYPGLFGLCKAGSQYAGLEPQRLAGISPAFSIFHRLDQQGNSVDTSLVPFASNRSAPPMAFKDSLRGVYADLGIFYYSSDGGKSWQSVLDSDSAQYHRLRTSRDGNCFFGYGISKQGNFLARVDNMGNRSALNFNFSGGNFIRDIVFSSCDTGLVISDYGIYKTTDGGLTFQIVHQSSKLSWHLQFKQDTLFLAGRDTNYYSIGYIGPFIPIAAQPHYNRHRESGPYFFFNAHRVISYDADESKFRIADTRHNFCQSLSLPVDYIYDFLPSDSGVVAIGAGGQFYGIREEALFPANIGLIEGLSLQPELKVYPNPSKGYLSIEGGDFKEYRLYNLKGHLLDSGYINERIDISKFQSGIYILELNGLGESASVRRLIYRE
tara:strand:+ start:3260 stop:5344 length:2085 start_codon:yes stop_codon:yes gene_type:complete